MGYLHEGHLSLVERVKEVAAYTVVSIFVNPTQFNNKQDFETYPIDIERDLAALQNAGVDLVYTPSTTDIYPYGVRTMLKAGPAAEGFEGACRPGHFDGVVTVVNILFNHVQPTVAVFGEKDFQQVAVIQQMVEDLSIPVEIITAPLIREPSGLAMSSRNVRLSEQGRRTAAGISSVLIECKKLYQAGSIKREDLEAMLVNRFAEKSGIEVEYASIINDGDAPRALFAGYVEGVRLIDTLIFA
jgi:pantoate--beta-alanine ligase